MTSPEDRGLSRRTLIKAALAIGGSSALTACQNAELSGTPSPTDGEQYPRGDPTALPDGQHSWDEYLVQSVHGTETQSQHQLILGLEYTGSVPPTDEDRETVESALAQLEQAFRWGSGADTSGSINDGLLFLIGYAPRYCSSVDLEVPGLQTPETMLETLGEDSSLAAPFDAVLLLDSDYASILLAAEQALFSDADTLNGLPVDHRLTDQFDIVERRTGVLGKGRPAATIDNEDIPKNAPLSMGFRAGFENSLPPEEIATRTEGPYPGGTTLVLSRVRTDLESWYDQPHEDRRKEMYCPAHTHEEVGEIGDRLGSDSKITEENVDSIAELAEEHGIIGHAQKVASARSEDFTTQILRRSEGVATDTVHGSTFNFSSIQDRTEKFVEIRTAMSVDSYDLDVPEDKHGIVSYLETLSRSTYFVPPRAARALPSNR